MFSVRSLLFLFAIGYAVNANAQTAADLYRLGNMKFDLGDYRAAIAYYDQSLAIDKYNAGVYFNRGSAYYNLAEYTPALADFTRVINLNAQDIKAYILRGFCKYHLGDKAGACTDWDHAGGQRCYDACELIDEYCK